MAISDSLVTAHENLMRVIPKPLTAEEEAERVRTGMGLPDVDPAALHDGARRFVNALSADPAAAAELERRGTLCAALTGEGNQYAIAKINAQKALSGWNLAAQFAEHPVYLDFLQGTVRSLLQATGEELVAEVRDKYEWINRLLAEDGVPQTTRPLLEAWRDAAWAIVSKGENESLDGCYWLLHADNLQYDLVVPAAAPEVRQAADTLVKWWDGRADNEGKGGDHAQLTPEARAILFVHKLIKTTGKLPTKTTIAKALEVNRRTLNNWSAFKVAYKKLQSETRREPARGTKAEDGTLEAWRESGK